MTEHNGTALHYLSKTFPSEKCVNLLDGPVMHSLFWHYLPQESGPVERECSEWQCDHSPAEDPDPTLLITLFEAVQGPVVPGIVEVVGLDPRFYHVEVDNNQPRYDACGTKHTYKIANGSARTWSLAIRHSLMFSVSKSVLERIYSRI